MVRRAWIRALGFACFASLLAACSSPAASLQFQAPNGWKASPSLGGFAQVWQAPDESQMLMLMKFPVTMNTQQAMKSANMNDAQVQKREQITICGGQPATMIYAKGTSPKTNTHGDMEMVMTSVGGSSYFAIYARPDGAAANAQAESAIHQLCPKK